MAGIQRIDDERSATALADLLNGTLRTQPVVVVTIPASRTEPWIDVDQIAREAGDLAEVYLMPTGPFTWEFSRRMAAGTQVYGGAGRVYPVGHEWASDLRKSPLRFAWSEQDGPRVTQELISDALRMAAAAGVLQAQPARQLRRVDGVVKGMVAGRGLVDVGNPMPASIAEELTAEDVPIERLLAVGQPVSGWYDSRTNRVDVTTSLRPAGEALADYSPGDVVLAQVVSVRGEAAELLLYPRTTTPSVTVAVRIADVTGNPFDDLRTLMTAGEVVAARVTATEPDWALVLNDVDDDEPVRAAPSLLAGGPPWLVEEPSELDVVEAHPPPVPRPSAAEPSTAAPSEPTVVESTPALRPTPAMLDKNRAKPAGWPPTTPASAQQSEGTRALLLKIDGLTSDVNRLKRETDDLRTQLQVGASEREQLRYLLDQTERRANRTENEVRAARSRLRKAGRSRTPSPPGDGPRFADPEQGFRYLVLTRWATRTLPGEQADRPLPDYLIGPGFLDSLDRLEGISQEKVADVAFEIVTGLAPQIAARLVHLLRSGPGGDDPFRVRDDGAKACRASLQVNTPSARRIHYWLLPNGQYELARVANHDDFEI